MENVFMKKFMKKFITGLAIGMAIIALMIIMPIVEDEPFMGGAPWYLVPVVAVVTLLYGTGWTFAFNLLKRSFKEFFRIAEYASWTQAIFARGLIIGLIYATAFLLIGSILSVVVGNYFMIRDFFRARKGLEPTSEKYKFGSDKSYSSDEIKMAALRDGVNLNLADIKSDKIKAHNEEAIRNIENGIDDSIITTEYKNGKNHIVETHIHVN